MDFFGFKKFIRSHLDAYKEGKEQELLKAEFPKKVERLLSSNSDTVYCFTSCHDFKNQIYLKRVYFFNLLTQDPHHLKT